MKTLIEILNENKTEWGTPSYATKEPLDNDFFVIIPEMQEYGFTSIERLHNETDISDEQFDEEMQPLKKLKAGESWNCPAEGAFYLKIK